MREVHLVADLFLQKSPLLIELYKLWYFCSNWIFFAGSSATDKLLDSPHYQMKTNWNSLNWNRKSERRKSAVRIFFKEKELVENLRKNDFRITIIQSLFDKFIINSDKATVHIFCDLGLVFYNW